jgi:transcription antitermination factor NusG
MTDPWYAIRVRRNSEQAVTKFLSAAGYEAFVPTYRDQRQWTDRTKQIEVPFFPGYVFSRLDVHNRLPVLKTPGVVEVVRFGEVLVPVADEEIASVQALVKSAVRVRPWPYLNVGDRVIVDRGPLAGVEGILLATKDEHKLIVSVYLLQRSIAVEIDVACVQPVKTSFTRPSVDPQKSE